MRIDSLLHALCLFKSRSQATKACGEGRVLLNGAAVRASHPVHVGDRIRWRDTLERFEQEVVILEIPARRVSKAVARSMVRVIAGGRIEDP